MLTRKEFEDLRLEHAKKIFENKKLQKDALDVLTEADKNYWIHQSNWFGEPVLQLPQDMFAIQEIVYKTRPDYIVELGVAWGGSTLFYSSLLGMLGGSKVVGVDIYIPDDLVERLSKKPTMSDIHLIRGPSTEESIVKDVHEAVNYSDRCLLILDSYHTEEHVLEELGAYKDLVGEGCYIICADTIVEDLPEQLHRKREWGLGNNPRTALKKFLKDNTDFHVDEEIRNKLLFSCHPDGYIFRE